MARHLNRYTNWKEGTYMRVKDPDTIRMLMDAKGYSTREVALVSGGRVKHAIVGHVIKGTRQTVTPETAAAIADVLHADVTRLFTPENDRDRTWLTEQVAA